MSKTFNVQAVVREGFDGVYRAQRKWLSGSPTEITVVDQDECPTVSIVDKPGAVPRIAVHPTMVGRKAFAMLEKDPRITIKPLGGLLNDGDSQADALITQARAARDTLAEENRGLKDYIEELKRLLSQHMAAHDGTKQGLEAEIEAGIANRALFGRLFATLDEKAQAAWKDMIAEEQAAAPNANPAPSDEPAAPTDGNEDKAPPPAKARGGGKR